MVKEYERKDCHDGYSIRDMQSLDGFVVIGGTKEEYDKLKESWNVSAIAFDYLILKELKEIKRKLSK
jgi:hypothetical protein